MQRLLRGLKAIPDMRGLEAIDNSLWKELTALTALEDKLQAYLTHLPRLPMTRRRIRGVLRSIGVPLEPIAPRKKGATEPLKRKGPHYETLIALALVEEFRRVFKKPSYRNAAILLHEASPKHFAYLSGVDAADRLGRLVRRVPTDKRATIRQQFFA